MVWKLPSLGTLGPGSKMVFDTTTTTAQVVGQGVNAGTQIHGVWTDVEIKKDNQAYNDVTKIKIGNS